MGPLGGPSPRCGRRRQRFFLSLGSAQLAAIWACLAGSAAAWDKDGHEAIGMTAMSALETSTVTQVKRLMGGRDAVDVAGWAHKVSKKYPWTTDLHMQTQPEWRCTSGKHVDLTHCPDNKCLVRALKHFYGRLIGQKLMDIEWPSNMHLTDADAVKFMINLIGDLHQPMHFGIPGDNMGRNATVMFRGRKTTLYDLWDGEITQAIIKESPGFWWGGWTHVQRTRVEYEKDGQLWKTDSVSMFDKWAEETSQYLCQSVYTNPRTGRPLSESMHDGVIRIDEGLFETWKRDMLSRMLVAGARTAIVLNAVLAHRSEATHLSAGTAVSHIDPEEDEAKTKGPHGLGPYGRGESHKPRGFEKHWGFGPVQGPQAGLINLFIFAVTLTLFLTLMKIWQGSDPVWQAHRAKVSNPGGGKST